MCCLNWCSLCLPVTDRGSMQQKRMKWENLCAYALLRVVFMAALTLYRPAVTYAEYVAVCYDYGCHHQKTIELSQEALAPVALLMSNTQSAVEERALLGEAVGFLYQLAGLQTPIFRDRGGNFDDDRTQSGAMDCIDHSTTASAFLQLLARNGWLRFHRVESPISRGMLLTIHWGARISDKQTAEEFIIDRWFFDHGHHAAVLPIEDWMDRKDPVN